MTEANSDPNDRMEAFVDLIYEEGDPNQPQLEDDPTPLYQILKQTQERYKERSLIGRGGMKEVYKVYDLYTARYIAMALPREDIHSSDFDTFLREAHITARLSHPNIINLYDMGLDEDGRPFFTMDFKGGQSLRKTLKDLKAEVAMGITPALDLSRRLGIFVRICEAVSYAHAHHVLHLDLKPENVQLGSLGQVQVCDWGLGVVLPRPAGEDDTHVMDQSEVTLDPDLYGSLLMRVSGTLGYMPPEQQHSHIPKAITMDIYALGQILFELISLHDLDAPKKLVKNSTLLGIVNKATQADPEKRYAHVHDLLDDIHRYENNQLTSVDQNNPWLAARLFYKRHTLVCNITAISLTAFLSSVLVLSQKLSESQEESQHYQENFLEQKQASALRAADQADEALFLARRLSEDDYISSPVYQQTILESERQLRLSLENNPPKNSMAWSKLLWILFLKQDFAEAFRILQINPEPQRVSSLLPYIRHYGPNMSSGEHLSTPDLIDLIQSIYRDKKGQVVDLVGRMLVYDTFIGRSQLEYYDIMLTFLSRINSKWNPEGTTFEPKKKHLSLVGSDLKRLCFNTYSKNQFYSVLMLLELNHLDLSQSGVQDLRQLRGAEIYELNMAHGLNIYDILELQNMPTLRKLLVKKDQLIPSQLEALPEFLEVEYVP